MLKMKVEKGRGGEMRKRYVVMIQEATIEWAGLLYCIALPIAIPAEEGRAREGENIV
jgi:hypothetical protein